MMTFYIDKMIQWCELQPQMVATDFGHLIIMGPSVVACKIILWVNISNLISSLDLTISRSESHTVAQITEGHNCFISV